MSKAANIYWDSTPRTRPAGARRAGGRQPKLRVSGRTAPRWVSFVILISIFVMVCVSINYRAFIEASQESARHAELADKILNLQDENLALQEEIHTLKTDPEAIRREARKIGMHLQLTQVPVPVN